MNARLSLAFGTLALGVLAGCATTPAPTDLGGSDPIPQAEYTIGPGDTLEIFVWQHPEVSVTAPVRPDGRISTPLVEDIVAVGKTPTQLARDLEAQISQYIRAPTVSVIVTNFVGTFDTQVRVVGKAMAPQAIPYRQDMTLLDVMIEVGGLAENAAGNRSKVVRQAGGEVQEIPVRVKDLINDGEISANIRMMPGDVLVIPESRL